MNNHYRLKAVSFSRAQYLNYISRMRRAINPIQIKQRNIVIGTNNSWFGAREIDRNPAWVEVSGARYVWSQSNPSSDRAIVSTSFTLPRPRNIRSASLFLSVDNYAIVLVNGRVVVDDNPVANPANFNPGRTFNIRPFLRRRINDVVIIAFNFGGNRTAANPAGVAARIDIRLRD
ncbi:hypothetical protein [Ammoniphilus sp. CFH 90114]|uniref:hypothetical protein n=1 Tax=Ammoniphilus sp. CFH 90114 TaxID=2493665 RepID=UPI00100E69CA|nr:hypothetical protein [Ammoniphilus sp. CFH 90114]RXT05782.1 hypothetical protein EIZ39_16900 [Ammoniphilus sp. CFH 90114]